MSKFVKFAILLALAGSFLIAIIFVFFRVNSLPIPDVIRALPLVEKYFPKTAGFISIVNNHPQYEVRLRSTEYEQLLKEEIAEKYGNVYTSVQIEIINVPQGMTFRIKDSSGTAFDIAGYSIPTRGEQENEKNLEDQILQIKLYIGPDADVALKDIVGTSIDTELESQFFLAVTDYLTRDPLNPPFGLEAVEARREQVVNLANEHKARVSASSKSTMFVITKKEQ